MDITTEKVLFLMQKHKVSATRIQNDCELNHSAIYDWKRGKSKPSRDALHKISHYFQKPLSWFYEDTEAPPFEPIDFYTLPVLVGVSAGYDHAMHDIDSGEYQEIPASITQGYKKNELAVFRVEGDSMSPKFLDGDRVLVVRRPSVDSGAIAIVAYDYYENGTLKKVQYEQGCNYVDLIPLNDKYEPVRLKNDQLAGMRIIGQVIYLFRQI